MSIAIGALCLIAFVSFGFLVYTTERAHRSQDHLDLQYRGLIGFIELDATVCEIFTAAKTDFFGNNGHRSFDRASAERDIAEQLAKLENNVLAKALFLKWPQSQLQSEQAVLQNLREEVSTAFKELDLAYLAASELKEVEANNRARFVFDERIKLVFGEIVAQKIASEQDLMLRTQRETRAFSHLSTSVIFLVAAFMIGISLWAIFNCLWQLQRGLDVLLRGTHRLASGDLTHRIELEQQGELGQLAQVFNRMAAQFEKNQTALRRVRNDLEDKVVQRTEELNNANIELKERDEHRRQFFADIGHELRTPVTAIRGQAEVALRSKDYHLEQRTEALHKIVSLSDQLSQDVSALFFIAREQAGVIDLRREPVDLGDVSRKVVGNMSAYFEKQRAIVQLVASEETEYLVEGTESRLTQLLGILLTNAVVHSHTGVTVRVMLTATRKRVSLSVGDNGPGIPPAARKRVFERFYRMESQFKGSVTSTGLGLPIARSLVHAHGGMIRIDESDQGGTEVRISFQRYHEEE